MFMYYRTLGVSQDATDAQIREQYLSLVRQYTPEKHPEQFRDISDAYERIKDRRRRIHNRLFAFLEEKDVDRALDRIVGSVALERRRPTLDELLNAEPLSGAGHKTGGVS